MDTGGGCSGGSVAGLVVGGVLAVGLAGSRGWADNFPGNSTLHTVICIVGPTLPGSLPQSPGLGPGDYGGTDWKPIGPSATCRGDSPVELPWGVPCGSWFPWEGAVEIGKREGNTGTPALRGVVPRMSVCGGGGQGMGRKLGCRGMTPVDTPVLAGEHPQGSHPAAGPSRDLAPMLSPPLS